MDLSWLKKYFFMNKIFLFFKMESWNFQYLFEIEYRETSQNFKSFSLFRQLLFSFFLLVVWLSWNFVNYFSKKNLFKLLWTSKQNSFVYQTNFPRRFWLCHPFFVITLCNLVRDGTSVLLTADTHGHSGVGFTPIQCHVGSGTQ